MGEWVGIDLGTTRSVIAHIDSSGKPEVIRNEEGHITTPSVLYFSPQGPVVGDAAKTRRKDGQHDIIQLFKRNIDNEHFLFTANGRDYTPIDLSACVLAYLKVQAESALHKDVTDAVITVPAYFTDPQRKATIAAGEKAGLRVLKVINEPTAAALAYSHSITLQKGEEQCVLVYDLGGGTFDVSLVRVAASAMHVLGSDGNHRLGGVDWDGRLLAYIVSEFEQSTQFKLSTEEAEGLLDVVEQAKYVLSIRPRTSVIVRVRNETRTFSVTRAQFEEMTRDLMVETEMLTERLLQNVGVNWSEITAVLPVGGASRMPMVRAYLERAAGKAPLSGFSPDEIVALGAAWQAEQERSTATTASHTVVDVIAHSLGMIVESADRAHYLNNILIQKHTPIPVSITRAYRMRLRRDGKTQLEVFLTQGEERNPRHSVYLGRYVFSGFPALREREVRVDVTYEYDKNGLVHISASEHTTGQALLLAIEALPPNVATRFATSPAARVRPDRVTIYLAFDLSGSMTQGALDEAKQAACSFVEYCQSATIAVGLISFADHVKVIREATTDKTMIRHEIENLVPHREQGYGNNDDPFAELYRLLAPVWHQRYAVVLTDGAWARPGLAIERAQRCHAANIEVFAVGFGDAHQDFLIQIASSAEQGILVDMKQLVEAFSTIAQEIVDLEVETLSDERQ